MSKFILSLSIFAAFFVPGLCSAQWIVNQSAVESAARDYRIQIYHSFRTNRAEYDLRRQAGTQLLEAWHQAGKPKEFQASLVGWFGKAQQTSLAASPSPLPPQPELPKKVPAQLASDRNQFESVSDDLSDEPWGDLDFENENDSGDKTFISDSKKFDDADFDNNALLKDNSIENPFLTKPSVDSDRSPFVEEGPQAKDEPAETPTTQEESDDPFVAEPAFDPESPFALEEADEEPSEENPLVAPHLPKLPRMKVNDEAADSKTADSKTVEALDPADFLAPPTPLSISPRDVRLKEFLRQTGERNIEPGKPATVDIKPGDAKLQRLKRSAAEKAGAAKKAKLKKIKNSTMSDLLNHELRRAVKTGLPQKSSLDPSKKSSAKNRLAKSK